MDVRRPLWKLLSQGLANLIRGATVNTRPFIGATAPVNSDNIWIPSVKLLDEADCLTTLQLALLESEGNDHSLAPLHPS